MEEITQSQLQIIIGVMVDLNKCIEKLERFKILEEKQLRFICEKVKEILMTEPNVKIVQAPVTVCGDIHGQFYDLLEIFEIGGKLPNTNYLFMGDYVDRGFNSVETLSYMLTLKIMHPDRITLLRGNHENKEINKFYGFYEQCVKKYGNENVWQTFTEVFQFLPLAATIKGQFFCLHGGLSPSAQRIDQIKHINRVQEIPQEGIMCDLMWSDPEEGRLGFGRSPRQVGYIWGVDQTEKFCHTNNLRMICRAHQLVMEGFNEVHNKQCVTVFSAPNYCYRCNNLASIVEIDDLLNANYQQYEPAPRENEPRTVKRVPSYFL